MAAAAAAPPRVPDPLPPGATAPPWSAMTPCLLALDTSTELLSVALGTPDGALHASDEAGGALASSRLIPALMDLLQHAGVSLRGLDAIAFGQGPGAFTGLRTACAVAQGLAFGAALPVLAIDSLLIVAEMACGGAGTDAADDGPWWVAMDARIDEVYAAAYQRVGPDWRLLQAPALYSLPALAARWQEAPPQRVAGNAPAAFGDRLPCDAAQRRPATGARSAALLRLARAAWRRGEAVAADQALPLYLRDKVALTTAERALQRAAGVLP